MYKAFVIVLCLVFLITPVFAAGVVPSDRFYFLDVQTNELGQVVILFPSSVTATALALSDDNNIINTSGSAITGYIYTDSSFSEYAYSVRWSALGTVSSGNNYYSVYPSYRSANSTNSYYQALTITAINDTNLDLASGAVPENYVALSLIICLLFVLMFVNILKRRR